MKKPTQNTKTNSDGILDLRKIKDKYIDIDNDHFTPIGFLHIHYILDFIEKKIKKFILIDRGEYTPLLVGVDNYDAKFEKISIINAYGNLKTYEIFGFGEFKNNKLNMVVKPAYTNKVFKIEQV